MNNLRRALLASCAAPLVLAAQPALAVPTSVQWGVDRTTTPWTLCVYDGSNTCQTELLGTPDIPAPSIGGLAALRSLPAGIVNNVVRAYYTAAGDAPPLTYVWKATCPGTADNLALYVAPNAGGTGCWSAAADPNVWYLAAWGVSTSATDIGPVTNTAIAAAQTAKQLDVTLPSGVLNQQTTISPLAGVHLHGGGGAPYGSCPTTVVWTGAAGTMFSAVSAAGSELANPGLTDMCVNGNSLAAIGFNKRGVSAGQFARLVFSGMTQYGVYEDTGASPTASDQLSRWTDIQVICATGTTCWRIGSSSAVYDVSSNIYDRVQLQHYGTATGFDCGNSDGNEFRDFYAIGVATPTGYGFVAEAGTTNSPAPNSCRENFFTGSTVMMTGMNFVASASYGSFGTIITSYKTGDGEPQPTLGSGAGAIWTDTLGQVHVVSTTAALALGVDSTGQAPLEVNRLANAAMAAKFGSLFPLYITANGPSIMLNAYWNGSANVYGPGSSSSYAGQMRLDPATGVWTFSTTTAAGNAGAAASLASTLTLSKTGDLTTTNINATGVFQQGGSNGVTKTCTVVPTGMTIKGGIITAIVGGTCS